jgi:hypothetical protein
MLPLSILIFPIVGGYYLVTRARLFQYRQQRFEQQRLIFNSFFGGITLLIVAWIVAAMNSYFFPSLVFSIQQYSPLKTEYFGTCTLSLLIAVLFTELSNLFIDKTNQVAAAIRKIGNELECLCELCYNDEKMMQLTLKNDKCYVGWIQGLPIPTHSNYIVVLPVLSGYRSKLKRRLIFTTDYLDVYSTYVEDGSILDIRDITKLVIKIDDIITASSFDLETFERFNDHHPIP